MNRGKSGGKLAFCGVMTALAVGILLMTVIPITEISLAALAGIVGIPVVIEAGRKSALMSYAAASILSLLLIPAIEGKALYIAFFGYYPVLKAFLESRSLPRAADLLLKLASFNVAMIAVYWVLLSFFSLDPDSFRLFGVSLPWVFLLLGNGVFLVYDWCLTRLVSVYCLRFRPKVRHLFRF